MSLFDPDAVNEAWLEPWDQVQPLFYYFQTSGRSPIGRVRAFLEQLFTLYPLEHQDEMSQRIRTAKVDFDSPFFELLLNALMIKFGAEIEVHPKVRASTDRRPDFLVRLQNGFEFYLEAVLATSMSDADRARQSMLNEVTRVVNNRLRAEQYFLALEIEEMGKSQPSAKKLVNDLFNYLSTLSSEEVGHDLLARGFGTKFCFTWEHEGWKICFIPIPRKQSAIGKPYRPMGATLGNVVWSTAKDDIRGAVEYKCKHHSDLGLPYVIAVNATHWSADDEDFVDGLYGSESYTVPITEDGPGVPYGERLRDGVWIGKVGYRNQNLIGVLGVHKLGPSSVASRILTFFENPYTGFPPAAVLPSLPRVVADDGKLKNLPGLNLGAIFELSDGWPRCVDGTSSEEREYRDEASAVAPDVDDEG